MVEKTTRLMKSPEGIGKNLTTALRSMGFSSISEALNQGPYGVLGNHIASDGRQSGGVDSDGLWLSRHHASDIRAPQQHGTDAGVLRQARARGDRRHNRQVPRQAQGETWWYQRDRLRSAYLDSQLKLMEAMIPVLTVFANSLEKNK